MKVNDTIKHIFKEAVEDFKVAKRHGHPDAQSLIVRFKGYLKMREVPFQDIAFLYDYYKKQIDDMKVNPQKYPEDLKTELIYMFNHINSMYEIKTLESGLVAVTKKSE